WASVSATGLAFLAASLSSVQTFFNFSKMAEGHRSVANRYLSAMMQCENLLLKLASGHLSPEEVWKQHDRLTAAYIEINVEAEAFPTTAADLRRATRRDALVPFTIPGYVEPAPAGPPQPATNPI